MWPLPEHDKVFKLIKPKLLNPSGGKYGIQAILIDTRAKEMAETYGNWVTGVVDHIRDQLKAWGYTNIFLLTDATDATKNWDPSKNPAVMFQQETHPVAVIDTAKSFPRLFWANSVFLHWYGSEEYGGVSTAFFRSIATKEIFYQQIGWVPRQTEVDAPVDEVVGSTEVMKKLAEIEAICNNILALLRKK
jgi:hypothetical protein